MNPDISALQQKVQDLEQKLDELQFRRVNFNTDIIGAFEAVSSVPTSTPKDVYDQVKVYNDGTNKRLYVYQPKVGSNAAGWFYASLT